MPQVHVLAPVPALHVESAFETMEKHGVVAFGTKAWEIWKKWEGKDAQVWIVASSTGNTGLVSKAISIGKIVATGTLERLTDPVRGQHPDPRLRPPSTITDKEHEFLLYWEVSNIVLLPKPISLTRLTSVSGRSIQTTPQRAIELKSPPD